MRDKIIKFLPDLSANDVRSTSMGAQGVDIQLSEHALRMFPFSLECKARATFDTLYGFMQQAKENSIKNTIPGVVLKANHKNPIIVIELDDFLDFYSQLLYEAKNNGQR